MGRKKHDTPPQWICPVEPLDKPGGFGRLYYKLITTDNYKALSYGARCLYNSMIVISAGKKEFHLTASEAEYLGFPKGTIRRLTKELIKAGFIKIKESGRLTRTANIYEFTLNYTMISNNKGAKKHEQN